MKGIGVVEGVSVSVGRRICRNLWLVHKYRRGVMEGIPIWVTHVLR